MGTSSAFAPTVARGGTVACTMGDTTLTKPQNKRMKQGEWPATR